MDLLQDGDEAVLVDLFLFRSQRLSASELLQDVIHAGDGEIGMQLLLPFAVRVELLAELADALLQRDGWVGEGEGKERCVAVVSRIVSHTEPAAGCHGPLYVYSTR